MNDFSLPPDIQADVDEIEAAQQLSDAQPDDRLRVDHLLAFPVGDGRAYYVVVTVDEEGRKFELDHRPWLDAWTERFLGGGGWFDLDGPIGEECLKNVRGRRAMSRIFGGGG